MFYEPGNKMKRTAEVLLVLGVIGAIILAAVFGRDKYGDINVVTFLVIAVCGGVSVFISSLVLYGIGDAIDDIAYICSVQVSIKDELERIGKANSAEAPAAKAPSHPVQTAAGAFNLDDYI